MKITALALVVCVAFYALMVDMCIHLDGWRVVEPFAFFVVFVLMASLGRVIFGDGSQEAA